MLHLRKFLRGACTMRCGTADNSGALLVGVIGVLRKKQNKNPKLGDLCTLSVKAILNSKDTKVKKKQIVRGVLAATRKNFGRKDGSFLRCYSNAFVLVDRKGKPLASRVLRPIAKDLKRKEYKAVCLKAEEFI